MRSDFARFVLRFGLLLGALNLLLLVPWVHSYFVLPWTILNAGWAAKLVSFTGEGYVFDEFRLRHCCRSLCRSRCAACVSGSGASNDLRGRYVIGH